MRMLNKKLIIGVVAFAYLAAPYGPVICHALTHAAEMELASDHTHTEEEHRHEHDSEHHALPLVDKVPAVTSQKIQLWLSFAFADLQFSGASLNEPIDLFQALRQKPAPNLGPPQLHLEQGYLSAYSAHSPPA